MTTRYHTASPAAILGGAAAAGGAMALLCRDAFVTGWTVELALRPLLAVLTILCGHLAVKALRRCRLLSAVALAVLAISGSTLLVYEAMGTRAEIRDAKVATATDGASQRHHMQKMLAEAEENVTRYRTRASEECATGKGKKCDGAQYTVATWEAAVAGYEKKLKDLGAPKPIDPKGERITAFAGMLGVRASADDVQRSVALIEPLVLPLFLELSSIVLFGYGLGRGRRREVAEVGVALSPRRVLTDSTARDRALEDLRALVQAGHAPESQDWLAARWNISKSAVSKWMARWEAEGALPGNRIADGRIKTIAA